MKSVVLKVVPLFAGLMLWAGCGTPAGNNNGYSTIDAGLTQCIADGLACDDDNGCCSGSVCIFGFCRAAPACGLAEAPCDLDAGTNTCCDGLNCVNVCNDNTCVSSCE